MNAEDTLCIVCRELMIRPCTLPCGHNMCHDHVHDIVSNTKDKGSCPMCRCQYSTNIGVNIQFDKMLKALYPEKYSEREVEMNNNAEIRNVVERYKSSKRHGAIFKCIEIFLETAKVATYFELEYTVKQIFAKYGYDVGDDEIKVVCYCHDGINWNSTSWGVYTSSISRDEWINYAFSLFARNRVHRGELQESDLIHDVHTKVYLSKNAFSLTQDERNILAELALSREKIFSIVNISQSSRFRDTSKFLDENIDNVPTVNKTKEWLYHKIGNFVDVDIMHHFEQHEVNSESQPVTYHFEPRDTMTVTWDNNIYRSLMGLINQQYPSPSTREGDLVGTILLNGQPLNTSVTDPTTINSLQNLMTQLFSGPAFGIDEDEEINDSQ